MKRIAFLLCAIIMGSCVFAQTQVLLVNKYLRVAKFAGVWKIQVNTDGNGNWQDVTGGGGGITSFSATQQALKIVLTDNLGGSTDFNAVNGSVAGMATPIMYAKFLESFKSYTLRNSLAPGSNLLLIKSDSLGVMRKITFTSSANLGVDTTTGTKDSSLVVTLDPKITVQNEGVDIGSFNKINFTGAGVDAVANGSKVDVTIPGGGGGGSCDVCLIKDTTIGGATAWTFFLEPYFATYKNFIVKIRGLKAAVSTDQLTMLVSGNHGSTFDNSTNNYKYVIKARPSIGNDNIQNIMILLAGDFSNVAGDATNIDIMVHTPADATTKPSFSWYGFHPVNTSTNLEALDGGAWRNNAQATHALRWATNGGTMSCNMQVWGLK